MEGSNVVKFLVDEAPSFNVQGGKVHRWRMQKPILDWLSENLNSNWTTLETGAGYTTTLFASAGCNHFSISPSAPEHKRIADWCNAHDISTENINFIPEPSQDVLPKLDTGPLNLVLIDGAHAWPFPYLDWYYTADKLVVGGFMIVDDLNIITGEHLYEFLKGEEAAGRWKFIKLKDHTAIFQKTSEELFGPNEWHSQPYLLDQHRKRAWKWTSNPTAKVKNVLKKSDLLYRLFSKHSKLGDPNRDT